MQSTPPCASADCHLTWAVVPMALGDVGAYARRVEIEGVREYAAAHGISQNFDLVATLEDLKPAMPWHFYERSKIKIKNNVSRMKDEANDFSIDSRIHTEILVNDVPTDVIFDSGATLTLPDGSASARTLDSLPPAANSRSGLGKVEINSLAIAKKVSIGNLTINNLIVKKKEGLKSDDINAVGLFGYDLLLRFESVDIDLSSGTIEFNPRPIDHEHCAPMELALDNNRMPTGIVTNISIDGVPLKARIDTGANVDVMLHGKELMSWKDFRRSRVLAIDGGGHTAPLDEFEGSVSLGAQTTPHTILRVAFAHGDFKATLGIKFFAGRRFTFDFKQSRFCLD